MKCEDIDPETRSLLKQRVENNRKFNVTKFCRENGVTRTQFYDILNGEDYTSPETLEKVILALGFSREQIKIRSASAKLTPV